jgi:hypothetical protein
LQISPKTTLFVKTCEAQICGKFDELQIFPL